MKPAKAAPMRINASRFFFALMAAFSATVLFDFIFHGILLTPLYEKTAHLWRSSEEMMAFMPLLTLTQFVTSAFLVLLFIALNIGEGLLAGLRFGSLSGILLAFTQIGLYPYMSMPLSLAAAWFIGTLVKTLILCVIVAMVYKKS